jgi:hypothetical protein
MSEPHKTTRPYKKKDPIAFDAMQAESRRLARAALDDPLRLALLRERRKRKSPYPNTDARRNYMRRYMSSRRASETTDERSERLASARNYMKKKYRVEKLGGVILSDRTPN